MIEPAVVKNHVALDVAKDVNTEVVGVTSIGSEKQKAALQGAKISIEAVKSAGVLPKAILSILHHPMAIFGIEFIVAVMESLENLDNYKKAAFCEGVSKVVIFAAYGNDPQTLTFRFREGDQLKSCPEERLPELAQLAERQKDIGYRTIYQNAYEMGLQFYAGKQYAITKLGKNGKVGKLDIQTTLNILYRTLAQNAGCKEHILYPIQF